MDNQILTENWETMEQIRQRSGKTAEEVFEVVSQGYRSKTVNALFESKNVTKFRLQNWKKEN